MFPLPETHHSDSKALCTYTEVMYVLLEKENRRYELKFTPQVVTSSKDLILVTVICLV